MRDTVVCALFRSLAYLHPTCSVWLGRILANAASILRVRAVRTVDRNLAIALPELNWRERKSLRKKCLTETATALLQTPYFWRHTDLLQLDHPLVQVTGSQHLQAIKHDERGAVLVTPHLGNWEILGLFMALHTDLMILYKPHRIKCLREITETARSQTGAKLAPTDHSGLRMLVRQLKSGGCVGLLPDQVPAEPNGVFAPFFGVPAYTSTLTGTLAKRHDCPIYIGYALRKKNYFEICIERIEVSPSSLSAEQIANVLNAHIERLIRRCPEQYNWTYKRFRRLPPGIPAVYTKS